MENGSELLRLLAQLENAPAGENQQLAIWMLAVSLRELNKSIVAVNNSLLGVITENDLDVPTDLVDRSGNVNRMAEAVNRGMDLIVEGFAPEGHE